MSTAGEAMGVREDIERWMRSERIPVGAHVLLSAASGVYGLGVGLRLSLYRSGIVKPERLPVPVISVGNLTVGGTGKTPVTMHLARLLKKMGRRPAVVSRGYGGTAKGPAVVSDGEKTLLTPAEAGDEPVLMARSLPGVPVVVSARRAEGGRLAFERFSSDVLILDDGFQHIGLARDLDILLVDGRRGFGNGYLVPRGVLREPARHAGRADLVLVKDGGAFGSGGGPKGVDLPAAAFEYRPGELVELGSGEKTPASGLRGRRVTALSAIAEPGSFASVLTGLGAEVAVELAYPDHHAYSPEDVKDIGAASEGTDLIVTTEKDAVKLALLGPSLEGLPIFTLTIDLATDDDRLRRALSECLEKFYGAARA